MSLKSVRTKKNGTPRAMPVETIVTRFKSAQQKKQTEEKTKPKKCFRNVNNKLKKNETAKPKSNVKITEETKEKEYYPDKLKRKTQNKKIVLAPKHFYKVIGDKKNINKRKSRVPQKDLSKNCQSSTEPEHTDRTNKSELSIFEMISIIEDNEGLNEEDFLEILTCPSPVWWEDPPDEWDYVEEPISFKSANCTENSINSALSNNVDYNMKAAEKLNITEESICDIKEINISKLSDNFKHKRRKLEDLLCNIKNKTQSEIESISDVDIQSNIDRREKRNSESTDGDLFGIDDEILYDLENMEIPIASADNKTIAIDENNKTEVINDKEVKHNDLKNNNRKEIIYDSREVSNNSSDDYDGHNKTVNLKESNVLNSNLNSTDPLHIQEKQTVSELWSPNKDSMEYVTLYKIISDDETQEKIDDKNKMNSYYKQCKNIRKQRITLDNLDNSEVNDSTGNSEVNKDRIDNSEVNEDSILISDSHDFKYCMKCSCIFDTGHCKYCVNKQKDYSKRAKIIKTEYLNLINKTQQETKKF